MQTSSPPSSTFMLPSPGTNRQRNQKTRTVLLVENAPSGVHELLELECADLAEVVRATSGGALDLLMTDDVNAAIVDLGQADDATSLVIALLSERGVPFVVIGSNATSPDMLVETLNLTLH